MLFATYIAVTIMTIVTWVTMVVVDMDADWPLTKEDRASYSWVATATFVLWMIFTAALIIRHWS